MRDARAGASGAFRADGRAVEKAGIPAEPKLSHPLFLAPIDGCRRPPITSLMRWFRAGSGTDEREARQRGDRSRLDFDKEPCEVQSFRPPLPRTAQHERIRWINESL